MLPPPRTFASARPSRRPPGGEAPAQDNLLAQEDGCCVSIDRQWRVTGATAQAAAWIGATLDDDLIGANLRDRVPIPLPVFGAIEACLRRCESRSIEAPSVIHPGRWVQFSIHGFDGGARIDFTDATERRLKQADVTAGGDLLHHLTDAVSAEMALLDGRGVVVSVNAAWRDAASIAGQVATGLGHSYVDACQWLAPELDRRVVEKAMGEILSGVSQSFVHTCERSGPEGPCWRQVRIARLRVGSDVHIVAIHEDLTEAARAQAALRDTSEQLLCAQEDERRRIAIELHDSTSQHLVALGLGLVNLRRVTAKDGRTDEILEDMSKSLKEAVKEIRVLSYLMTPPAVEREGLAAHTRRFVCGFGARTGLQTHFSVHGPVDAFDAEVQHTVFRVIQEALANAYKHASAKGVSVGISSRRGALEVRIADDGKGVPGLADGRFEDVALGVGITGMRSRMAQLGGDLRIESGKRGTVVTGLLPPPLKRSASARGANGRA